MVVKRKESFEKIRHVKNNDESKKYILRKQRNTRYYEKIYQIKRNFIRYHNFVNFLQYYNRYRAKKFSVN